MNVLGIDIGGSALKYGVVCTTAGTLDKHGIRKKPTPATARELVVSVGDIATKLEVDRVGIGFPGVIEHGYVKTAAHLDPHWIGKNGLGLFQAKVPQVTTLLNDADAALLAEHRWGACRGFSGSMLLLTLGTGIGSAMMVAGKLWPNSELGHAFLKQGIEVESWAAASVRHSHQLNWRDWGERLNDVLREMKRLCHPERIVLGGAISESYDHFTEFLDPSLPVMAASLGNRAGVMGAAFAASLG